MKEKRSIMDLFLFFCVTYFFYGIVLGFVFQFLKISGLIKVKNWRRFPRWKRKVILISNHPSMLDPFLLPFLFFRSYFLHPFKYAPWSTPDKKNFYDPWYWFFIRPLAIPISRGDYHKESIALREIKRILDKKGVVIIFPEGGRTFKGRSLLHVKGGKIRPLKQGISWLALETRALIVPVYIWGTDKVLPNNRISFPNFFKRITINIGVPVRFEKKEGLTESQISLIISSFLLDTANEG